MHDLNAAQDGFFRALHDPTWEYHHTVMKRLFVASRDNPEAMATLFGKELPDHESLTAQPGPTVRSIVADRPSQRPRKSTPPYRRWPKTFVASGAARPCAIW